MRHILAAAVLTGCFYVAPIDQRPSIDIIQVSPAPGEAIHRGDMVDLRADGNDPDGDSLTYAWHISACSDANTCDDPFRTDTNLETDLMFQVPVFTKHGDPVVLVTALLDATDALGAPAKPTQQLPLTIIDVAPVVTAHQASNHHFVVDSHIELFAEVTDLDDTAKADGPPAFNVTMSPGPNATFDMTDLPSQGDVDPITYGKSFVPHDAGTWKLEAVVIDKALQQGSATFDIDVGADLPPCITQPSPIASPTQEFPMFEATLFQVLVVTDDLDVYPPPLGNDPDLGTATFSWSIEQPGASSFSPLAITSNGVQLDPATYQPNDLVKLRVEVHDRINRDFSSCLPDDPTCALDPTDEPGCLQRVTWTVRVQ